MKTKIFVVFIALLAFTNIAALGNSASLRKTTGKNKQTSENVIYACFFRMIVDYDAKSEQSSSDEEKDFFKNFYKRAANLSDEQYQMVKSVAYNFINASAVTTDKNRKTKLSLQYKAELKKLLGADFPRFDEYVKTDFARSIIIFGSNSSFAFFGSANISVNQATHQLLGVAGVSFNDALNRNLLSPCGVSATMSGPNVSEFGSNSSPDCGNPSPSVSLVSTTYLDNTQYCITANFTGIDQGPSTLTRCVTTPGVPRVTAVTYEQIVTDDLLIDENPNAGGGLRIFPDKKTPNEQVNRRKIRVRAKYGANTAGIKIYFRNFDVDDPSANTAPIDNEASPNAGNDNNGNVDGTVNTRAGQFSLPNPNIYACETTTSGVACFTDSNGETIADFTVTMQPGDNFTVAASTNETYLNGLALAADGINLKDTSNTQIPATTINNNIACSISTVNACRAEMLTVWRRVHLEVDSMENVGDGNKVTGTITAVGQAQNASCNPLPPPAPPPVPPCYPTVTAYTVDVVLDPDRFENGRILIGTRTYNVLTNSPNAIFLKGTPSPSGRVTPGTTFILYDDDDYNADDNLPDGDRNEPFMELPITFRHLSSADGNYPEDGRPRNTYASAYIMPERAWAESAAYNQRNLPIILNVMDANLDNTINANRNSIMDERDDFWIAYFLLTYQGDTNSDGDGEAGGVSGTTQGPFTTEPAHCDCYLSSNCVGTACSILPKGGFGSVINLEAIQDTTRTWRINANLTTHNQGTTVPHELGHQFGLKGDSINPIPMQPKRGVNTYKIMDYLNRPREVDQFELHPEHINILRRRIKSPGA